VESPRCSWQQRQHTLILFALVKPDATVGKQLKERAKAAAQHLLPIASNSKLRRQNFLPRVFASALAREAHRPHRTPPRQRSLAQDVDRQ
jgi:hypothetical protein